MDEQQVDQTETLTDTKVRVKVPSSTKMAIAVAFLGIAAIAAAGAGIRSVSRNTSRIPVEAPRLTVSQVAYNYAADYAKQARKSMSESDFWQIVYTSNIFMSDSAVYLESNPSMVNQYTTAMEGAAWDNFGLLKKWHDTIYSNQNPAQLKKNVWLFLKERVMKKNLFSVVDVAGASQDMDGETYFYDYELNEEDLMLRPLNPAFFNAIVQNIASMSDDDLAFEANSSGGGSGSINICLDGVSDSSGIESYVGGGAGDGGGTAESIDPTAPAPLLVEADPTPEVNEPQDLWGDNPLFDNCPPGFGSSLASDPEQDPDPDPEQDPEQDPDPDPEQDPEQDPDPDPEQDPGTSGTNNTTGGSVLDELIKDSGLGPIVEFLKGSGTGSIPQQSFPGVEKKKIPKAKGEFMLYITIPFSNISPEQMMSSFNDCGGGLAGSLGSSGCMPFDAVDWNKFMEAMGFFWTDPSPIDLVSTPVDSTLMYTPASTQYLAIFDFISGQQVLTDLIEVDN